MCLDMVAMKGIPLTNSVSMQRSTFCWEVMSSGGMDTMLCTTGWGLERVVLPLIVGISGPKILMARSTSASVTGQSLMEFIFRIALRSSIDG